MAQFEADKRSLWERSNNREWLVCHRTQSALNQLNTALGEAIVVSDPQLRRMAYHLIAREGKRLRPTLLLLVAQFGDPYEPDLLKAATAMELLHVASLYHDDIMDRAPARRGESSANVHWGNRLAALAGTYLLARASVLLASLGDIPNQVASQAAVELCSGQLQEMENAYNLELTEAEHLNILTHKTAILFELPCRLGTHLSNVPPPYAARLIDYSRHLGLAFQLADDALDLVGQVSHLGKATGIDLREGVYSLPVLKALRQGGEIGVQLKALLRQAWLTKVDMRTALKLVDKSGTVTSALEVAQEYKKRAQEALDELPDGSARQSLLNLADYAITRSS